MVNGFVSDSAYAYTPPSHLHRHRWDTAEAETLLKRMVREYDALIKKGQISYYFITVVRLDTASEDLCSYEVIKKRVPLKEKVQLNANAKRTSTVPDRFGVSSTSFTLPQTMAIYLSNS